jgi:hypothetical protein
VLVELSETEDAWLRDLRAASMRCLALLSTADALKPRLAHARALPLLCSAGVPSFNTTSVPVLSTLTQYSLGTRPHGHEAHGGPQLQ